jgi:hypothetical protein
VRVAALCAIALLASGCGRNEGPGKEAESAVGVSATAPGDSVAACYVADQSVLARDGGTAGTPALPLSGWIRLDLRDHDSASAKFVDSDGFAIAGVWRRNADSVVVAGFNDFVRIELRLRIQDSVAHGTLLAHSDAALERDSLGKLREFVREGTIQLRESPCDSMPREAGAAAIDVLSHRTPRPGIRFDASSLKPGMRVGTLVADSVIAQRTVVDSTWVGTAAFRGQIELSGWTLRHTDPDLYHVVTCFEADSSSAARLPRWAGDERRTWFCFSNRPQAAQALGPPSEGVRATILIDRFTIHRGLSDDVNIARFVRIVRR